MRHMQRQRALADSGHTADDGNGRSGGSGTRVRRIRIRIRIHIRVRGQGQVQFLVYVSAAGEVGRWGWELGGPGRRRFRRGGALGQVGVLMTITITVMATITVMVTFGLVGFPLPVLIPVPVLVLVLVLVPVLVPQDLQMRLAHCGARLDPEFLDQAGAQVTVDGQGLGLTSGAVQYEHQQPVEGLPQGCSATRAANSGARAASRTGPRPLAARASSALAFACASAEAPTSPKIQETPVPPAPPSRP